MIAELKEFAGLEQQEIAERTGWTPTAVSRVLSGAQETVYYTTGKAMEALYTEHEEIIRARKEAKAKAILESLGAPAGG